MWKYTELYRDNIERVFIHFIMLTLLKKFNIKKLYLSITKWTINTEKHVEIIRTRAEYRRRKATDKQKIHGSKELKQRTKLTKLVET